MIKIKIKLTDEKSMGLLCARATLSESLDQIKVTDDIKAALVMCVVFCLLSIEHGRGIDGNLVRSFAGTSCDLRLAPQHQRPVSAQRPSPQHRLREVSTPMDLCTHRFI